MIRFIYYKTVSYYSKLLFYLCERLLCVRSRGVANDNGLPGEKGKVTILFLLYTTSD
ncbi:hypothetical protein HBA_0254 [Sodalis endosymbiont of Henestaris halophilus]|nr:hypothetical protein HBA_0254 [Sodalis endosymbiont of Henestaris halophilus]